MASPKKNASPKKGKEGGAYLIIALVVLLIVVAGGVWYYQTRPREGIRRWGRGGWRPRYYGPWARPAWAGYGPLYGSAYDSSYLYGHRHSRALCRNRCARVYEDCKDDANGSKSKIEDCSDELAKCMRWC